MISAISSTLAALQMQATLDRLDVGTTSTARVRVYATDLPVDPATHTDTPMATVVLPRPCGVLSGAQLTLTAADAALVMLAGIPHWAELVAADGAVLHVGDVTDAAGDGFWKAAGAATPVGETAPYFVAGGLLSLGSVVLT